MPKTSIGFAYLGFIFGFVSCFVGACWIGDNINARWRQTAIEHGAAEYCIVDEATGAVEFRWKEGK